MSISTSIADQGSFRLHSDESLSDLLSNLKEVVVKGAMPLDTYSNRILQEAVQIANIAEQRLAEQRHRIAYLESLSVTDELTGLFNRRGLEQVLDRVLASARRYDETGMLAYIDLDGFKQINDRYGHDAGDAILKHTAKLILKNIRTTDYAARLGGDEFVIVFVHAEPLATRARALTLKAAFANSPLLYQGKSLSVEASIGLESYGAHSDRITLLRRADTAMYQDKKRRQTNRP